MLWSLQYKRPKVPLLWQAVSNKKMKEGNNMENLDQILQAISTTGFPIIVCLILMWYVNKQLDTHKEETNALKDVIAENTAMVQKLTIMIENKYKVGD